MSDVGPLAGEPPWLARARHYYGLREIRGPMDEPTIVRWHMEAKTPVEHLSDELAWCGVAAGACMREAGIEPPPKYYRAAAWANWGEEVPHDTLGALLIIHNPAAAAHISLSGNHVTFGLAVNSQSIYGLGGNQGNMFRASTFPRSTWTIRSARWPTGHPRP